MDYPDKIETHINPLWTWSDLFMEQHKYGPYPPMIEYYKKTFGIKKSKYFFKSSIPYNIFKDIYYGVMIYVEEFYSAF